MSGNLDFFKLLGLPVAAEPDLALLERNYRSLQATLHPDRYVNAAPTERLAALQRAGMLNEAYATLKSPLWRAGHLLALLGIDGTQHRQQDLAPDFLLAQMELREELEDCGQDPAVLAALHQRVKGQFAAAWREFADQHGSGQSTGLLPLFHKLQFLHRLLEEIAEAEDRLLD